MWKVNFEGLDMHLGCIKPNAVFQSHHSFSVLAFNYFYLFTTSEETGDCPSNCRENVCVEFYFCQQAHVLCSFIVFY